MALVSRVPTATPKLNWEDQVKGSARRGRGENNTCETFRRRQIKTTDKSSDLDRVHLTGFKAMHLLEPGGFKRIKVAAADAASKSLPCFDIISLSRAPVASTRQRLHNTDITRLSERLRVWFAPHAAKQARRRHLLRSDARWLAG